MGPMPLLLVMLTTPDMLPTLSTLPTTLAMDTLDTKDLTLSAPTIMLIIWARGPLTLRLMPTPLDRSTKDFPLPMLLLLVMPTTPDMLPTLNSLPTHTLDTLDIPDFMDTLPILPILVKQHYSK